MVPNITSESGTATGTVETSILQPVHASREPSQETPREASVLPIARENKTTANKTSLGWKLSPFRLLKQDVANLKSRYRSDWTTFNQQVIASAIYIFFTNILPGITFANDLNVLTGQSWGTIEVVFSTGLCGAIFAMYVGPSLTIIVI